MSLLTKLCEKFKNIKDETKKRIVATVLAGGIALSGLGLTGCTGCNPDPNNTNPPVTNPGDDNGETQNPGNNNGGNNSGSQTPDYSKYSQILQNVLTDQYYTGLITTDKVASEDYGNKNSFQSGKFKALPFAFLEDEGYNIEQIKKNQVGSSSNLYTIGNELYIEIRVETKTSTNYYTHYLIKYILTNQEIKELDALFTPLNNVRGTRGTYYQAPLFVQELSYQKNAQLISKAYITQDATKEIEYYFNKKKYNSNTNKITYMKSVVLDSFTEITHHTFQTHVFADNAYTPETINLKTKLNTIILETGGTCCSIINNANVFTDNDVHFYLTSENEEKYKNSTTDINLYSCENSNFEEINTVQFNRNLSN